MANHFFQAVKNKQEAREEPIGIGRRNESY